MSKCQHCILRGSTINFICKVIHLLSLKFDTSKQPKIY
nr:MAG TPA: hypothetical protein [Crassvirales sp.]